MPIKTDEISFTLDLSEQIKKVPKEKRKEVTELIGVTLIDSISEYTGRGTSPVSKGAYKKKMADGKTTSDLYESGNMFGNFKVESLMSKVRIKITKTKEKLKSYNHNTGDTLPVRKFLPDDTNEEKFKPAIMKKVMGIIDDASKD
tara:strand:- start:429 stop:863 length:435 start_codon:yes stop_codon:yes gene_type:complete